MSRGGKRAGAGRKKKSEADKKRSVTKWVRFPEGCYAAAEAAAAYCGVGFSQYVRDCVMWVSSGVAGATTDKMGVSGGGGHAGNMESGPESDSEEGNV